MCNYAFTTHDGVIKLKIQCSIKTTRNYIISALFKYASTNFRHFCFTLGFYARVCGKFIKNKFQIEKIYFRNKDLFHEINIEFRNKIEI